MTNIIQYLDICQECMKRLRDMGINPKQMVIEVAPDVFQQACMVIQGQGEFVTALLVENPFKAEILNKGLIKLSRGEYTFHLTLKIDENRDSIYPHIKSGSTFGGMGMGTF